MTAARPEPFRCSKHQSEHQLWVFNVQLEPLEESRGNIHIDHTAIYLLIAGTYTPVMLINLRGPWGWSIFGVVWGLALLGIAFQYSHLHRMELARVTLYVLMGWTAVVAVGPLLTAVEPIGLVLIFAGGIAYTGGLAFYAWNRLPYNHAIWHLFVLAGSICHFFAVLYYVVPQTA